MNGDRGAVSEAKSISGSMGLSDRDGLHKSSAATPQVETGTGQEQAEFQPSVHGVVFAILVSGYPAPSATAIW
jgi:hypothetical protein